jgi:hypothetical protein
MDIGRQHGDKRSKKHPGKARLECAGQAGYEIPDLPSGMKEDDPTGCYGNAGKKDKDKDGFSLRYRSSLYRACQPEFRCSDQGLFLDEQEPREDNRSAPVKTGWNRVPAFSANEVQGERFRIPGKRIGKQGATCRIHGARRMDSTARSGERPFYKLRKLLKDPGISKEDVQFPPFLQLFSHDFLNYRERRQMSY